MGVDGVNKYKSNNNNRIMNTDYATILLEEMGLPDGVARAIAEGCEYVNNIFSNEREAATGTAESDLWRV